MSKPFKMKAAGHNNSPMQKNFPKDISANPGDTPLEKFDWGSAIGGALKGAKAGMAAGPWGAVAGALGGGALSGFGGGRKSEEPHGGADDAAHMEEHERLRKENL
jgi:hypothetical protein